MANDLLKQIFLRMDDIEKQLRILDVKKADLSHEYELLAQVIKLIDKGSNLGETIADDGIVEELPVTWVDDGR